MEDNDSSTVPVLSRIETRTKVLTVWQSIIMVTRTEGHSSPVSWSILLLTLLLRLSFSLFLQTGYVHPDEFFQSGQELIFGCPEPFVPWEFEPDHRLRSFWPTIMVTRLSLWIQTLPTGWQIWKLPGVWCILFSFWILDRNLRSFPTAWWFYVTSWTAWVMLSRPFSNTFETLLLALLTSEAHRQKKRHFLFGVLCSLGLFCRFTFVCFGLPCGIHYLRSNFSFLTKERSDIKRFLSSMLKATMGFLASTLLLVWFDSYQYHHYGTNNFTPLLPTRLSIAPLNAYMYNKKKENLAQHGLHPFWTHAVVNVLILFGPAAFIFYRFRLMEWNIYSQIIVVGVGLLSLAPHQEPRFLLPCLYPICLEVAIGYEHRPSRLFKLIWIVFNLILGIFFGILHQGAVLPSLLDLGANLDNDVNIIYYKTYMAPSFALRVPCQDACSLSSCMRSGSIISLDDPIALQKHVQHSLDDCNKSKKGKKKVVIVAPYLPQSDGGLMWFTPSLCSLGEFACVPQKSYFPHLATEDFPPLSSSSISESINRFQLTSFDISC